MKKFIKIIDRSIGIKLKKNPTGLYTQIKGSKGEEILQKNAYFDEYNERGVMPLKCKLKPNQIEELISFIDVNNNSELDDDIIITKNKERTIVNGLESNWIIRELVSSIEKESGLKFKIINAIVYRNFGSDNLNPLKISGDWHFDRRPTDWIRIFTALSKVEIDDGPLTYINRRESLSYISNYGYDRNNDDNLSIVESIYNVKYFTAEPGETILADVQKIFHKAGLPKKGRTRDMMQIIIVPQL